MWLVTRLVKLHEETDYHLRNILSKLIPAKGVYEYIEISGFTSYGGKFKLTEDDPIIVSLLTLALAEIGTLLEVFVGEVTIRGSGPGSRNFGLPLDSTATKKYLDHIGTLLRKLHPLYGLESQWKLM